MNPPVKIVTCCYCGTRASLVLDKQRHELACSACGAPLHEMKMMPQTQQRKAAKPARPPRGPYRDDRPRRAEKPKKRKKRKGLGRKIFEEIWDIAEDIFD